MAKGQATTPEQQEVNLESLIAKQEKDFKRILSEMPKKTIHIPRDPNNPKDVVPIGWNGIIYAVPRGKSFEVPAVIADIWLESYEKTQAAHDRIDESVNMEVQVM